MSDDIVARLRSGFISPTCALDAADEITRLRDALDRARIDAHIADKCTERCRADLAAARELLKEARWSVEHCRLLKLLARIDAALKGDGE